MQGRAAAVCCGRGAVGERVASAGGPPEDSSVFNAAAPLPKITRTPLRACPPPPPPAAALLLLQIKSGINSQHANEELLEHLRGVLSEWAVGVWWVVGWG